MRFPTMWYVRPAKAQTSLRIRTDWSEPLPFAWIFYDCLATDWTSFGVSELKRRLHMLVWVYTCLNATLMETTCCGAFVYVFKIRDQSIMVNKVCVWYYHHEMILALHRHGGQRKYTICMSMSIKLSPVKWSSTAPIKPFTGEHQLCNSYTMGCPPELGDNPWALVSGLSP